MFVARVLTWHITVALCVALLLARDAKPDTTYEMFGFKTGMTYAEVKARASKYYLLADTVDDAILRIDNPLNAARPFLISISFSVKDLVKQVKVQETGGTEINQLLTEANKKWGQARRPAIDARPGAEQMASIWGNENGVHVAFQNEIYDS